MIKLFQQKADNALEQYLELRKRVIAYGAPHVWPQDDLLQASALQAMQATWQRAADLLRKEATRS